MSHTLAFIEGIGGTELVVIMFVVLMLFGSDKLPGLARGMGKSIREFKKAASGVEEEIRQALEEPPDPKKFPPPVKPADTVAAPPPEAKFPPYPPIPPPEAPPSGQANAPAPEGKSPPIPPAPPPAD